MSKAMIMTVGTGRDRKDIAKGLLFSIRQHNPDYICFIVSQISEAETFPLITEHLTVKYESKRIEEINDVETIYVSYFGVIREVISKGYAPTEIVAEYTSGTKAMSAGLLLASVSAGLGTISYIYGERDSSGRVMPGCERPMSFTPVRIFAEKSIQEAIDFFNINRFESCAKVCEAIEKMTTLPSVIEQTSFLKLLAAAYDCWDRFDFGKALEDIDKVSKNAITKKYGIKSVLEHNKQMLYIEKENQFCHERVVDLLANAKRRFDEESRFDDGVARLYRAFEYLEQVKLFKDHGGLDTENIILEKLPASLRPKYASRKNDAGKIQVSLVAGYELLMELGDSLGKAFIEDKKSNSTFEKGLRKRNDSILAHGFVPMKKSDALMLLEHLERYLEMAFPQFRDKLKMVQFPKLKT